MNVRDNWKQTLHAFEHVCRALKHRVHVTCDMLRSGDGCFVGKDLFHSLFFASFAFCYWIWIILHLILQPYSELATQQWGSVTDTTSVKACPCITKRWQYWGRTVHDTPHRCHSPGQSRVRLRVMESGGDFWIRLGFGLHFLWRCDVFQRWLHSPSAAAGPFFGQSRGG